MIKLVVYFVLFISFSARALVPVEGILLGLAPNEFQTDPLSKIFSDIYDTSQTGENNKIKLFQASFEAGRNLKESCTYLTAPSYSTPWQEKQARRTIAANLQYIGLDTTIKAIGAYARKLDISGEEFSRLSQNLVRNYCSQNLTVFSLKSIEKSLEHYYQNPEMSIIPSLATSPFATEMIKMTSEKTSARSKEFDLVLRNFRAFCSWGGQDEDYRMLGDYLSNNFIMAFVIKNMLGFQDKIDNKLQQVTTVASKDTVQVSCRDLICRRESADLFRERFPLSVGSTGIVTDLPKVYCHHFRFQRTAKDTIPVVKDWIKAQELEDPIFETSQFIALMTGFPDLFNGIESYNEMPMVVRTSVDERWNQWAQQVIKNFSSDLLFEESFKVKVEPRRDPSSLAIDKFYIDLSVTLGEMDRVLVQNDKLSLSFELKLSKNYIRSIRTKWGLLEKEVDLDGQKEFRNQIGRYLNIQLKEKQKLFTQKMWNEEFSRILADELVQQAKLYTGPLFDSFEDEILIVPVKFSYGIFAISYLHYRSDIARGRVNLNL